MKWQLSCILLIAVLATATANVAATDPFEARAEAAPPLSVHSGTQWYWSASFAEAFFQNQKLSGGTLIYSATCQGYGASKASDIGTINLYNRFRCKLFGASFNRMASFPLTLRVTGRRSFGLTFVGRPTITTTSAAPSTTMTSPDSMTVANTTMPPGRTDAATAVTLAEQMLENDPTWSTSTIVCGSGTKSRYYSLPNATEETYNCKWVRQGNPSGPSTATDTVSIVHGASGQYLFSLVSSTFQPSGSAGACQINQASNGYRTSCHPSS